MQTTGAPLRVGEVSGRDQVQSAQVYETLGLVNEHAPIVTRLCQGMLEINRGLPVCMCLETSRVSRYAPLRQKQSRGSKQRASYGQRAVPCRESSLGGTDASRSVLASGGSDCWNGYQSVNRLSTASGGAKAGRGRLAGREAWSSHQITWRGTSLSRSILPSGTLHAEFNAPDSIAGAL